jgi:hypothetical protein
MTNALLAAPRLSLTGSRLSGSRANPQPGRGVTLAERLDGLWATLHTDGDAECPICRATMRLRHGVGECRGCGSKLS